MLQFLIVNITVCMREVQSTRARQKEPILLQAVVCYRNRDNILRCNVNVFSGHFFSACPFLKSAQRESLRKHNILAKIGYPCATP